MKAQRWKEGVVMVLAVGSLWAVLSGGSRTIQAAEEGTVTVGTNEAPVTTVNTNHTITQAEPQTKPSLQTNLPEARAIRPAAIDLPPALKEIVKLSEAKVGEEVILAYVQRSDLNFSMTPEQLVYLRDLGVSARVLSALLEHHPLTQLPGTVAPNASPEVLTQGYPAAEPPPEGGMDPAQLPPEGEETGLPPEAWAEYTTGFNYDPNDYTYFYGSLAPYGGWYDVPGYGWCWQPTACTVNRTWRPYCDNGRWQWTDHGWYWNSDYSWGWAPFHYGRWAEHPRYGWLWRPEREWSPAWVCWRESAKHCGWAPLPPGARFTKELGWTYRGVAVGPRFGYGLTADTFNFVPYAHLQSPGLAHRRLRHDQTERIFGQTIVKNEFSLQPNGGPFNRGIGSYPVAAATQQPVRPLPVDQLEQARFRNAPGFGTSLFPQDNYWMRNRSLGPEGPNPWQHRDKGMDKRRSFPPPAPGATAAPWGVPHALAQRAAQANRLRDRAMGPVRPFESLQPPNIQPPNIQPPNIQPPNIQPPNIQPPNLQPPNLQLSSPSTLGIPDTRVRPGPNPRNAEGASQGQPAAGSGWRGHGPGGNKSIGGGGGAATGGQGAGAGQSGGGGGGGGTGGGNGGGRSGGGGGHGGGGGAPAGGGGPRR